MGKGKRKIAEKAKRIVVAGLVGCLLCGECAQAGALEPLNGGSELQVAEVDWGGHDADTDQNPGETLGYDGQELLQTIPTQELSEADSEGAIAGEDAVEETAGTDEEAAGDEVTDGDEVINDDEEINGEEEVAGNPEAETDLAEASEAGGEEEASEEAAGADEEVVGDEDAGEEVKISGVAAMVAAAVGALDAEIDIPQVLAASPEVLRVEAESFEDHEGFNVNGSGAYIDGMNNGTAWALYSIDLGDEGGYNQIAICYGAWDKAICKVRFYLGDRDNKVLLGETEFIGSESWDMNRTLACYVPGLAEKTGRVNLLIEWENPGGGGLMNADYFVLSKNGRESIGAWTATFFDGDKERLRDNNTHIFIDENGINYVGYKMNFGKGSFKEVVLTGDFPWGGTLEIHLDSPEGDLVGSINLSGAGDWENKLIQIKTITQEVEGLANVTGEHDVYFVCTAGLGNFASFRFFKEAGEAEKPNVLKVEAESCVNHGGFDVNANGTGGMKDKAWALYNVALGDGGYNQIAIRYGAGSPGGTVRFYLCGAEYKDDENYKVSGKLLGETEFAGTGSWAMNATVACYLPDLKEVKGDVRLVIEWESPNGDYLMDADYFELSKDGKPAPVLDGIGAKASQFSDNGGVRNDTSHIYAGSGQYAGYRLNFGNGGFNELELTGDFINDCEIELRLDSSEGRLVRTISFDAGKGNWIDANIQTNKLTFKVPELADVTGEHVVYFVFKKGGYNLAAFRFYQRDKAATVKVEAESCGTQEEKGEKYDGFDVNANGTGGMRDKAWASYDVELGDGGYNQIAIRYGADSQGGTVRFYLCGADYKDGANYAESGRLLGETVFEGTGSWDMNETVACYLPGLTEVTGKVKLVIEWEAPDGNGYLMNADYFEVSADGHPVEIEEPEDTEGGLKVQAESYRKGEGVGAEGNHLGGLNTQAWAMYRVDLGTGGYNQIAIRYGADSIGGTVRLWLGTDFKTLLGETEFEGTGSWDMNSTVRWDVPGLASETGVVYLVLEWLSPEGKSDYLMNPDYFKLFRDEEPDEGEEPDIDENIVYIEAEECDEYGGLIIEGDHLGGLSDRSWAKYTVDLKDGGYNQFTIRYGAWGSGGIVRLWLNEKESGVKLGEMAFRGTGNWNIYDTVSIDVPKLAGETGLVTLVVEWECFAGSDTLMNPEHYEFSINSKLPEENEDDDDNLTIQQKAEKGLASFLDAYYVKSRYNKGTGSFLGGWFWDNAEIFEIIIDAYEHTGNQEYLDIMYEFFKSFKNKHGDDWSWNEYNDDIAWMTIACARAYLNTGDEAFLNAAVENFDFVWEIGWSDDLGGGVWWKNRWGEKEYPSKNACINCPLAIAACLLGEATGEESYYEKAVAMIDWVVDVLYDESTGRVYDNISTEIGDDGEYKLSTPSFTYNLGTFIGANTLLYEHYGEDKYYERARKTADYTINDKYKGGVMNDENNTGDLVGFKGILARWLHCFNEKCDEPDVMEWLLKNAESAWKNRNSYGLMSTQFGVKTWDDWDEGEFSTAFNASSAVSALFNCWPCPPRDTSEEPVEPTPEPSPEPTPEPSKEPTGSSPSQSTGGEAAKPSPEPSKEPVKPGKSPSKKKSEAKAEITPVKPSNDIKVIDETESDVKIGKDGLDLNAILEGRDVNPETQHIEVLFLQEKPSDSDSEVLKKELETMNGYSFVSSFEIQMKLSVDDVIVADITENFGKITLSLLAGREYAGREAIVYHLHDGEVLAPYDGLTVDAEGYVHVTVDKLSAFLVAVKDKEAEDEDDHISDDRNQQPDSTDNNTNGEDDAQETLSSNTKEGGGNGWIFLIIAGIVLLLAVAALVIYRLKAAGSRKE